jgi:hypothetical protein
MASRGRETEPERGAGYDGHDGSVSQLDISTALRVSSRRPVPAGRLAPCTPRASEGRACARRQLGHAGAADTRGRDTQPSGRQADPQHEVWVGLASYWPETLGRCRSVGSRTADTAAPLRRQPARHLGLQNFHATHTERNSSTRTTQRLRLRNLYATRGGRHDSRKAIERSGKQSRTCRASARACVSSERKHSAISSSSEACICRSASLCGGVCARNCRMSP